jgi:hypothetical protein
MSYLLRLWQSRSGGELVWRASLESPHTGERTGFATLESLFTFLQGQTGYAAPGDEAHGDRMPGPHCAS